MITATPIFEKLREKYVHASITLMLLSHTADVVKNNPNIDEIIIYNGDLLKKNKTVNDKLKNDLKILKKMRKKKFDLIVESWGNWLTLMIAVITTGSSRVDRGTVRIKRKLKILLNKIPDQPIHEVLNHLETISPLGIEANNIKIKIYLTDEEKKQGIELLKKHGIFETDNIIAIHPGGAWEPRRWSVTRFIKIANWCILSKNMKVIIIGGPDEISLRDMFSKFLDKSGVILIGETNLRETMSILNRVTMLVCNDSGMMHIASALEKPVVALFGPQYPEKFGYWGEKKLILHKKVPCFPCKQKVCKRPDNTCVNLITVDEVKNAINTLLEEKNI